MRSVISPRRQSLLTSPTWSVPNTKTTGRAVWLTCWSILSDDYPDYPALVLGNYMLGGAFLNSRLATRIRQKEGLSYGVGSQFNAGALDPVGPFRLCNLCAY